MFGQHKNSLSSNKKDSSSSSSSSLTPIREAKKFKTLEDVKVDPSFYGPFEDKQDAPSETKVDRLIVAHPHVGNPLKRGLDKLSDELGRKYQTIRILDDKGERGTISRQTLFDYPTQAEEIAKIIIFFSKKFPWSASIQNNLWRDIQKLPLPYLKDFADVLLFYAKRDSDINVLDMMIEYPEYILNIEELGYPTKSPDIPNAKWALTLGRESFEWKIFKNLAVKYPTQKNYTARILKNISCSSGKVSYLTDIIEAMLSTRPNDLERLETNLSRCNGEIEYEYTSAELFFLTLHAAHADQICFVINHIGGPKVEEEKDKEMNYPENLENFLKASIIPADVPVKEFFLADPVVAKGKLTIACFLGIFSHSPEELKKYWVQIMTCRENNIELQKFLKQIAAIIEIDSPCEMGETNLPPWAHDQNIINRWTTSSTQDLYAERIVHFLNRHPDCIDIGKEHKTIATLFEKTPAQVENLFEILNDSFFDATKIQFFLLSLKNIWIVFEDIAYLWTFLAENHNYRNCISVRGHYDHDTEYKNHLKKLENVLKEKLMALFDDKNAAIRIKEITILCRKLVVINMPELATLDMIHLLFENPLRPFRYFVNRKFEYGDEMDDTNPLISSLTSETSSAPSRLAVVPTTASASVADSKPSIPILPSLRA